jgi:hypothetical protein
MLYFPPGHEPARVLRPADIVPALRDSLSTLREELQRYSRGKEFDGLERYAESRSLEGFRLEFAVDSSRKLLLGWSSTPRAGFGLFPRCIRAMQRAVALLLSWEWFGGGTVEDIDALPALSLARDDILCELNKILEDLSEWQPSESPGEESNTAPSASASNPEVGAELSPAARAIAAAYDLQKEGKRVSVKAACDRAGVDRGHLREKYPEAIAAIRKIATPERTPYRGTRDWRTGTVDALDDPED